MAGMRSPEVGLLQRSWTAAGLGDQLWKGLERHAGKAEHLARELWEGE